MKDRLFLLKPGFRDDAGDGPFYCGDSAPVEGLLGFFPALRGQVDVDYIDFRKPRAAVVDLVGADHQSMPLLVLNGPAAADDSRFAVQRAGAVRFIDSESDIRAYLSSRHGVATAK